MSELFAVLAVLGFGYFLYTRIRNSRNSESNDGDPQGTYPRDTDRNDRNIP